MPGDEPTILLNMASPKIAHSAELVKQIVSTESQWRRLYVQAFVAGYQLGRHQSRASSAPLSPISRLKQLGTVLLLYLQDSNGVLPPMENAASLKDALLAYARSKELLSIRPRESRLQSIGSYRGKRSGNSGSQIAS